MPIKPIRVFISSSATDLGEYRDAAAKAIRRMRNHAEDMIDWSADERSPADASVAKVADSDLVILLVAHWYGSSPIGETRSFTELEYDTAKSRDIPVLVFIADPHHPWPPIFVETDHERAQALAAFKRRLESERTRIPFTSHDSLTAAITQAVANFDIRTHSVDVTDVETLAEPLQPRTALELLPDLLIGLGDAEDALPMAVRILRKQDVERDIHSLAEHMGASVNDSVMADITRLSMQHGRKTWTAAGIHDVQWRGHAAATRCYVTYENLTKFFAPSILTRALRSTRGISSAYVSAPEREEATHATAVSARYDVDTRVESRGGSNRFLALDVDSDDIHVVGWSGSGDAKQLVGWRAFMNESIRPLEIRSHEITRRSLGGYKIVANASGGDYGDSLAHLVRQAQFDESARFSVMVYISRQSLATAVYAAARELTPLHAAKQLHGDIKPQNILVTNEGVRLIDGLSLTIGEIAPALSPTWASPEQILLRPLTVACDIHAFGLILLAVVGGELAGEQATYVLPSEGSGTVHIPFIKDPVVYLDPASRVVEKQSREFWLDFIESCLRSDPAARPAPAEEFAQQLQALSLAHPLRGTIPLSVMPHANVKLIVDSSGIERPCHIITDLWTSVKRPVR